MAALPYMPLYVADYLADAAHLSTLEHGAYLLLIMTYWQRGEPLPSNDWRLARIARMSPEEWDECRDVLAEFFHDDGETWSHKRIDVELAKVEAKSEQARNARKARKQRPSNGRTTDVERPFNHTDTDTDTYSVSNETDAEASEDPGKKIWTDGVQWLVARGGRSEGQVRSYLGKAVKEVGEDAVLAALIETRKKDPVEPFGYLTRLVKPKAEPDYDAVLEDFAKERGIGEYAGNQDRSH